MTPEAIVGVAVGVLAIFAALWRVAKAGHRVAEAWEGFGNRLDTIERRLSNGITSEIREAKTDAAEACRLAGVAAVTASRIEEAAHDNNRATQALRSEVDILTNVILTDRQRIRAKLRDAGFDIDDDE